MKYRDLNWDEMQDDDSPQFEKIIRQKPRKELEERPRTHDKRVRHKEREEFE